VRKTVVPSLHLSRPLPPWTWSWQQGYEPNLVDWRSWETLVRRRAGFCTPDTHTCNVLQLTSQSNKPTWTTSPTCVSAFTGCTCRSEFSTSVLVYKFLHGLAPQYLGPLYNVTDLPGRRPLLSAGTNRLAVPPVKLTTVANQPGFPGCRPTKTEWSARRHDFSQIVIHFPSATQNSPISNLFFWQFPGLLPCGPSCSLHYLGHFKNPGLIDWKTYAVQQLTFCLQASSIKTSTTLPDISREYNSVFLIKLPSNGMLESGLKLEHMWAQCRHVVPPSTWSCATLAFDLLNWKLVHQLLQPWKHSNQLCFTCDFLYSSYEPIRDRRMDRQTDGQDTCYEHPTKTFLKNYLL